MLASCGETVVNTVGDPHFTESGELITEESNEPSLVLECPRQIKLYVEVSGSMNGFFRSDKTTDFKTDLWNIVGNHDGFIPQVYLLTQNGTVGASMTKEKFRNEMNRGAFVSTSSTRIPTMIETMINELDTDSDEVAVLVSDMEYEPVGQAAPDVLLSQYSTDVSRILGHAGKAVCLIGASSNTFDRKGNEGIAHYYYLIIGKDKHVGYLRNSFSTLMSMKDHFVENIETGFNYGTIRHEFGIPRNCFQEDPEQPTFTQAFERGDTCQIRLRVDLSNYRWMLAEESAVRSCFSVKALHDGATVAVGDIKFEVDNLTDRVLKRTAIATVDIKVFDMVNESVVLEWNIDLPDYEKGNFDFEQTRSLGKFITAFHQGGVLNSDLKPNYILISKQSK